VFYPLCNSSDERRGSGLKKICNEISKLYGYSEGTNPIFEST